MKTTINKFIRTISNYLVVCCLFVLLFSADNSFGNALIVNNLTLDQANKTVTFSISWRNSWRTVNNPFNWDAAWVFVKFRQCGAAPSTEWTHGLMSTTLGDHTFPANLEPTTSDGAGVGIDGTPDNTGVMLRRSATGVYPAVAATSVTLNVTNIPAVAAGIEYDFKIFGIEMVFVPTGAFNIGDGGAVPAYEFSPVVYITSENAVTVTSAPVLTTTPTGGGVAACTNNPLQIAALFPKGYNSFYCMKYEITSEQFAEFLNTVTANAGTALFPGSFGTNRNSLNNLGTPPSTYLSTRPNRAQNYLLWRHLSSYLDWACLRPMSEMEYEKACRGQGPALDNEYAWGNTTLTPPTGGLVISTTIPNEDGSESAIGPAGINCNWNNTAIVGGDAGLGPLRVGIFADVLDNTRMLSGSTFYGIMEMTGNVSEWVVPATAYYNGICDLPDWTGGPLGVTPITFVRTWGDGYIDVNTGIHNVLGIPVNTGWPPGNLVYGACGTAHPNGCYIAHRGASWAHTTLLQVSDRSYVQTPASAANWQGGRGVR